MDRRDIFSQFAARTVFLDVGLAVMSTIFCIQFALGRRVVSDDALLDPALLYATNAAIAAYGACSMKGGRSGYVAARDGWPLLAFCLTTLLAGIRHDWVWLISGVALACNIVFPFMPSRWAEYDRDQDRILIKLRWPF